MLDKKEFISILNTLKEYTEKEEKINAAMSEISPDFYVSFYPLSKYEEIIVDLLNEAFNLPRNEQYGTDIDYFIYELEFGKKWRPDSITYADGTSIDMSTPEKLYDYLIAGKSNE